MFSIIEFFSPFTKMGRAYRLIHSKNNYGINSIICHHTVRNKGDLDSAIKTKTSILAYEAI